MLNARRTVKGTTCRAEYPQGPSGRNGSRRRRHTALSPSPFGPRVATRVPRGVTAPGEDRSPLGAYLRDLTHHDLLSREGELDVAVRFRATGDPGLASRLVEGNLRLVVKIAREYRAAHANLADLVQEGNIGLIHAVSKFDPSRSVKLSTYASWWIRAYILNFIMSNHRLVRIGTTQAQRRLFFRLRKAREQLEKQGRKVEAKQLAAALDVTEEEVVEMEDRLAANDRSLEVGASPEGGYTAKEIVAAPGSRPDVAVETTEIRARLTETLNAFGDTLEGRELRIFRSRLFTDRPARLRDLAEDFGVSPERVRQLELRLKERVRRRLEDELGVTNDVLAGVN